MNANKSTSNNYRARLISAIKDSGLSHAEIVLRIQKIPGYESFNRKSLNAMIRPDRGKRVSGFVVPLCAALGASPFEIVLGPGNYTEPVTHGHIQKTVLGEIFSLIKSKNRALLTDNPLKLSTVVADLYPLFESAGDDPKNLDIVRLSAALMLSKY